MKKKKKKIQKTKQGSTYFFLFLLYNGFLSLSSIPSIPVYNHTMQVNTTLNTMHVNSKH